jgi:hypothetical protein
MSVKKHSLSRAVGILLLIALLSACFGPGTSPPPTQIGSLPTSSPFQPVANTPTSTAEAGALPPAASDQAFSSPTNASDIPAPTSVSITQPANNLTAVPPTIPPNNPHGGAACQLNDPGTAQPPNGPTNTPDIGTAASGDPKIAVSPFKRPNPNLYLQD